MAAALHREPKTPEAPGPSGAPSQARREAASGPTTGNGLRRWSPGAGRAVMYVLPPALVATAFARAAFLSSTGFVIAGDGLAYRQVAERMGLEGMAPFVFRPAVPLLVGALFPGRLALGFALLCAAAMLVALTLVVRLGRGEPAAGLLAVALLLDYPVLFNAANPARLDAAVLAAQLVFVALALRRRQGAFLLLLPAGALLKESLLLGLAPLALAAFGGGRRAVARLGLACGGFLAVHLGVRALATVTASAPGYEGGWLDLERMRLVLGVHAGSLLAPLDLFAAWGGLTLPAAWLLWRLGRRRPGLAGLLVLLLLFPLVAAIDLHRAWFELFAPLVLWSLLGPLQLDPLRHVGRTSTRAAPKPTMATPTASTGETTAATSERTAATGTAATGERNTATGQTTAAIAELTAAMALAVIGTALPYLTPGFGETHLFLQITSRRLGTGGMVVLALSLAASGLAAVRLARARL